jgi:hypothetical protein
MRHTLTALLSAASICAFACALPGAAWAMGGGDANAEADQAQLHPWMPNQTPGWTPYGVPLGEVYDAVPTVVYGYGYEYVPPMIAPPVVTPPAIAPVVTPVIVPVVRTPGGGW